MLRRPFGNSGLQVPAPGFGVMQIGDPRLDDAPLRHAVATGEFQGVQASVNLCDQQALPTLQQARARGMGTLAKRSLAGRPWAGADAANVDRNVAAVRRGALEPEDTAAAHKVYVAHGKDWRGLV